VLQILSKARCINKLTQLHSDCKRHITFFNCFFEFFLIFHQKQEKSRLFLIEDQSFTKIRKTELFIF